MNVINAGNFKKRSDLEAEIKRIGSVSDMGVETYTIEGIDEDFKRLHLSEKTVIFGVSCTLVSPPKDKKKKAINTVIPRGETMSYGIKGKALQK